MYDRFWLDWNEALGKFRMMEFVDGPGVQYVEAEADTGSRYVVLSSLVPSVRSGSMLHVTVAQPWQTTWPMQSRSLHHWTYVDEHLCSPHRGRGNSHGGDLAAVTVCTHLVTGWSLDEALDVCARMSEVVV